MLAQGSRTEGSRTERRGVMRKALVWTLAAVLSLGFVSCEKETGPALGHPAALLPEACHSVIHWSQRPDAAALALLRSLQQKSEDQVGMPQVFFEGPGVLAIYTDPEGGWSSRLGFVELQGESQPDLSALRAELTEDFVLELQGRRLWLLPKALAGFPTSGAPRLDQQGWFAGSLAGLAFEPAAEPDQALDLHFDLSRLLDLTRKNTPKADRQRLDLLVGIDSFLSLGMRVLPDERKGKGKIDLFFRLSRSPDGIAAALDVTPSSDVLARLLSKLPEDAGYLLMNFRIAILTDALKAQFLREDGTDLVGMAASMSKSFSVFLRGDLPRAFGNQWAIVDPKGSLSHGAPFENSGAYMLSSLDYSKKLGDQMLPWAKLGNLFGQKIDGKRIPGGLIFDIELLGNQIVIVLGKQFAALSTRSSKQTLLDLLAREAAGMDKVRPLPLPTGLPAFPPLAELRGRGALSLEFLRAYLPGEEDSSDPIRNFLEGMIAKDRRFLFQSLRVENGFLLQGRW